MEAEAVLHSRGGRGAAPAFWRWMRREAKQHKHSRSGGGGRGGAAPAFWAEAEQHQHAGRKRSSTSMLEAEAELHQHSGERLKLPDSEMEKLRWNRDGKVVAKPLCLEMEKLWETIVLKDGEALMKPQ